jgi:hypothetical protein
MSSPDIQPLSATDKAVLRQLKGKAWFTLLRLYVPLFLGLVYVYFEFNPGGTTYLHGHAVHVSKGDFATVFPFFAIFFAALFLGFLIRDFRRMILPFLQEEKLATKRCCTFNAKKYHDPLYDKRLLFYPDKDNYYIQVCATDFDAIANGEELYLEVAMVTGEVLVLRSSGLVFRAPEEFSFSDV